MRNGCLEAAENGVSPLSAAGCDSSRESQQTWTLYANGELVNDANRLCVDINGTEGGHGDAWMNACEDQPKQMWTLYEDGDDSFFLINKADTN